MNSSMGVNVPARLAALNQSQVRFSESNAEFRIEPLHRVQLPRKFTHSVQTGKNISKVRWLQDTQTLLIPDAFATEYFISGSWGDAVRSKIKRVHLTLNISKCINMNDFVF